MELLSFLLVVALVTAVVRRVWYPDEYEPLITWRGCLLCVLGLLVAVVVLGVLLALLT